MCTMHGWVCGYIIHEAAEEEVVEATNCNFSAKIDFKTLSAVRIQEEDLTHIKVLIISNVLG